MPRRLNPPPRLLGLASDDSPAMFEQVVKNVDDLLWKEVGCTTELDYTEQTSWLLFLKYLDALTREAPMGEVGMLVVDDNVSLGQRLVSYRANSKLLDNRFCFLLFALSSGDLQGQIHAKASGSTVQHMRAPVSKNLLLAAPPLPRQQEIVQKLVALSAEIQRLTRLYEQKQAALAALKRSLLHWAFSGQL